jgi:LAS superfamily LD-carboxypeptidase LdcB
MKLLKFIISFFVLLFIVNLNLFGQDFAVYNTKIALKDWIVITNNTRAYLNKELTDLSEKHIFNYEDKLSGVLLKHPEKGIRTAIVQVVDNNDTIYFPFPMLVELISFDKNTLLKTGHEHVDIETPLPANYKPNDLAKLDQKWNYHKNDYPKFLRSTVLNALYKMLNAAAKDGVYFRVVSAFRDFSKQRSLYIKAISKKGIYQIGTAKPGHSEHQLGTTVDLTSTNRKDLLSISFDKTPEGAWLQKHAIEYGFVQSYTTDNAKRKGYMPEPWHFRFVGIPSR